MSHARPLVPGIGAWTQRACRRRRAAGAGHASARERRDTVRQRSAQRLPRDVVSVRGADDALHVERPEGGSKVVEGGLLGRGAAQPLHSHRKEAVEGQVEADLARTAVCLAHEAGLALGGQAHQARLATKRLGMRPHTHCSQQLLQHGDGAAVAAIVVAAVATRQALSRAERSERWLEERPPQVHHEVEVVHPAIVLHLDVLAQLPLLPVDALHGA
mmetsp:Transcript_18014/g.53862  ORF Transcript_18014/g.53862 Transcript_18014/m.53862 type:complete len:216 (-) Transcript_18014:631-1278(-)